MIPPPFTPISDLKVNVNLNMVCRTYDVFVCGKNVKMNTVHKLLNSIPDIRIKTTQSSNSTSQLGS